MAGATRIDVSMLDRLSRTLVEIPSADETPAKDVAPVTDDTMVLPEGATASGTVSLGSGTLAATLAVEARL